MRGTREKVFGPGRQEPLDRNAKVRIEAYARGRSARHKQDNQHRGPLTRAYMDVLGALLWKFHNSRSGCCFPSYDTIARLAGCARSTVAEAIKALEWAGVLTWQNRLARVRERCADLLGADGWRWRVIRTSNAYVLKDPQATKTEAIPRKSGNPTGTPDQDTSTQQQTPAPRAADGLEAALASLGAKFAAQPTR